MKALNELMKSAAAAVLRGGELLLDRNMAESVSMKGERDYVTQVDTKVQSLLKTELRSFSPDVRFMGEEQDNSDLDMKSGAVWILDPVDGTSNLIHDYKYSAVSLALAVDGEVVLGIIYNPFAGELFSAIKGGGAFLNGVPISVGRRERLADCNISVGAAPGDRESSRRAFDIMRRIYDKCHDVRRMGAAALELCYVACGRQDGYYEFKLKPWDYAAGLVVVREAGGLALAPDGTEPPLNISGDVLAANPHIWSGLSDIINAQ